MFVVFGRLSDGVNDCVAQWIAHLTSNQGVVGSSPIAVVLVPPPLALDTQQQQQRRRADGLKRLCGLSVLRVGGLVERCVYAFWCWRLGGVDAASARRQKAPCVCVCVC